MRMKTRREIIEILSMAAGTEEYHRYSAVRGYPVITDGVRVLAEAAESYWLLDIIGSHQGNEMLDPAFQVWELRVNHEDRSAVVRGYNDTTLIITQEIEYTDFPLDEIKLYLIAGVILLPSEY